MKEYKYKINGNLYKVTIGNVEDNIADVEVNGTHYKVEMEKAPATQTGRSKTGRTPAGHYPPPHRPHKCPNRPPLPASRA